MKKYLLAETLVTYVLNLIINGLPSKLNED